LPALDGVLAAGSTTATGLLGVRLARALAKEKNVSLAAAVEPRIPRETVMLRDLALWANQTLFEAATIPEQRAVFANNLGNWLSVLGRPEDAFKITEEAVRLRRERAKAGTDAF